MSAATTPATAPSTHSKLRRAVVVTAAVLSVGALVGCGKDDVRDRGSSGSRSSEVGFKDSAEAPGRPGTPSRPSTSTRPAGDYPVVLKEKFIEGCLRVGSVDRSVCQCTIDKLEQTMPLADLLEMGAKGPDEMPEEALDAAIGCLPADFDSSDRSVDTI